MRFRFNNLSTHASPMTSLNALRASSATKTMTTTARVILLVKDLDDRSGKVREYVKSVDSQGYVSFTRGELSLPRNYEVWALAWGTENVNILYARSPFGGILLERVLVA